ncbi:MAG: TetR/AcrR family transcriptional regulator [Myxococcales bacterium]|nr:TetR/AcrR family transcriptional regulator [Myxococcales bacterium]
MPRPISIKDQTIIAAARAVFLERGFAATTAEVAERAGVSEGTLFNRFHSKSGLFQAAMAPTLETLDFTEQLEDRVGAGDLREHLTLLAEEAVNFFRQIMPLTMMSWSNPGPHGLPDILTQPNPPPLRALRKLSAYFEAEIRLGRLRPFDPEILARIFLGGVQQYVFFELVIKAQHALPLPLPTFIRGLVAVLWDGAGPDRDPEATLAARRSP